MQQICTFHARMRCDHTLQCYPRCTSDLLARILACAYTQHSMLVKTFQHVHDTGLKENLFTGKTQSKNITVAVCCIYLNIHGCHLNVFCILRMYTCKEMVHFVLERILNTLTAALNTTECSYSSITITYGSRSCTLHELALVWNLVQKFSSVDVYKLASHVKHFGDSLV